MSSPRNRYTRTCLDCGKPTTSTRCHPCHSRHTQLGRYRYVAPADVQQGPVYICEWCGVVLTPAMGVDAKASRLRSGYSKHIYCRRACMAAAYRKPHLPPERAHPKRQAKGIARPPAHRRAERDDNGNVYGMRKGLYGPDEPTATHL